MAKYSLGKALVDLATAVAAPATGGLSLILSPTVRDLIGNALGGGSDDNIAQIQQTYNSQMEQWKTLSDERRKELERLSQKEQEKEREIRRNEEEINSLKSKLNDPNISDQEKEKLRKRLIVLEDDNKRLKGELTSIRTQITTKESETPPAPSNPLTQFKYPKFSAYDKLLIAGILLLIIYFLFLRK